MSHSRNSLHKFENISFDHCLKCTICTAYCPVARATNLYPGPKQSGPDAERLRIKNPELVDESLIYCLNCKRCELVCPHGVQAASIIAIAKNKYVKKNLFTLKVFRNWFIAHTDFLGFLGNTFTFMINDVMPFPPFRFAMQLFLGIPRQRRFPKYQTTTFRRWFGKNRMASQKSFPKQVIYFHGCAVNYQEHQLGKDMIKVLNAFGYGVLLSKEKCCGVPLMANGYLDTARSNARHNIRALTKAMPHANIPIVSASSSCSYAIKNEYDEFLGMDNSAIKENIFYITKFLYEEMDRGNAPKLKPVKLKIAYHAPCHLQRAGGTIFTVDLLKKIPGLDAHFMHSECCGISGTYGFKVENYKISQTIGNELFKRISRIDPDYVVT
ncbi:MAG: anaerobic glycerol-3-phosphate dehydrogenase subunit GlpC, partial [Spirochaetota bacterium]